MECTQLVDLIFFMGQSNMAGRGDAALAPAVTPGMGFEYRAVTDPAHLHPLALQKLSTKKRPGVPISGYDCCIYCQDCILKAQFRTPLSASSASRQGAKC